jgi:hypothetical protein
MDWRNYMKTIISDARKEVSRTLSIKQDKKNGDVLKDGFYITGVPISLNKCTPTALSREKLKKQLNDMGLMCMETKGNRLQKSIDFVYKQIGTGSLQSFGIMYCKSDADSTGTKFVNKAYGDYTEEGWSEQSFGEYQSMIAVVQEQDNFDYLVENADDFPWSCTEKNTIKRSVSTVEAIRELFIESAQSCTSATVEGITKTTLDAAFSNALDAMNESALEDNYVVNNNRLIFLLNNYNEEEGNADGIGSVTCMWEISINNYKEKKTGKEHEAVITTYARSVLYSDPDILEKHYNMIIAKQGGKDNN